MKKTFAVTISILLSAMLLSGCGAQKTASDATEASEATEAVSLVYPSALRAQNEYKIIPDGGGKVEYCPYEIGSVVNAGDLLYRFEDVSISDSIATTKNSIAKADLSISTAKENMDNLNVYAKASGILRDFDVRVGQRMNATQIAQICDENSLITKAYFSSADFAAIKLGAAATLTSADFMSSVQGSVTKKYDAKTVSDGGSVLYCVEITLQNPAALKSAMTVTASVNGVTSPLSSTLEEQKSVPVVSRGSGNVTAVYVSAGERVTNGQLLFTMENSSLSAAYRRAQLDKSDLQIKLARLEKDYNDLFIYAPASGVVTAKSKGLSDTVTSSSESLMTISDSSMLSATVTVTDDLLASLSEGAALPVTANGTQYGAFISSIAGNNVTVTINNTYGILPNTIASIDFGGVSK